ncbi:hypothetical protein [Tepidibacter hydrothermalis]|uniref:Apea-like HEPN domain-containing protein n=1 Tax=Tepidibacter hydrothermalis TaxID=3036126 RepID=A0ABY8EI45_9FIRM|nr:hypothetical protein [Tepidibacter hydrothermalis]WFD11314.1 hypothetical protein P4S50_04350 [Tepidibacter hydrothermalis]
MDKTLLVNLDKHCYRLSKFLGMQGYNTVSDWLEIASGILTVEYNTLRFNDDILYCGSIYDYEKNNNILHKDFITELTRFSFIWSSLESIINIIKPKQHEIYKGKINSICYFLKEEYDCLEPTVIYYEKYLNKLIEKIEENKNFLDAYKRIKTQENIEKSGQGLFIIYKIRNMFAHGSLTIPRAQDYTFETVTDVEIINISSEIVLLSIQMILIAFLKNNNFIFEEWEKNIFEDLGNDAITFLKNAHLLKNNNIKESSLKII